MAIWKLEQINWDLFDASKVDQKIVPLIKMASLVEYNSGDYVDYLLQVFKNDEKIASDIRTWGDEERQHGLALRTWIEKVDPNFNFEKSFQKFTAVFKIPSGENGSIRGSQARELVSRCLIETGTATYYSALADALEEPVIKQICKYIAADEIRHYTLFHKYLESYGPAENLGRLGKIKTALGRIGEVEDEELALAYGCANYPDQNILPEDFKTYSRELMKWAFAIHKPVHFRKAARLFLNTTDLPTASWLSTPISKTMYGVMKWKEKREFGRHF